jgi:membrane dipeptidase
VQFELLRRDEHAVFRWPSELPVRETRGLSAERRVRLVSALVLIFTACATARPVEKDAPAPAPTLVLGADTHLHFTTSHAAKPVFFGEPGSGVLADSPRSRLTNQVEAEALRKSGVRLALAAVWPPIQIRPYRTSLDETVGVLNGLFDFAQRRGDFTVALSAKKARQALAAGQIALVPQVEGGEGITKVEDVDTLYRAGMRCLILVHFVDIDLGGASWGQSLDVFFGGAHAHGKNPHGLTPMGRAAVERMIDLGILIDLAHASDALANEVLDIAERRGVPVIDSHSGARSLKDVERNVSDALAQRVAKIGGLIGVSLFEMQVGEVPESARWPGFQPGTCDDVVAHWLHQINTVGPEHVVLGSDFNGFIIRGHAGGLCPNGMRNTYDLPQLFAALELKGVPRAALDGMGERLLGVLDAVEAKADKAAQARVMRRPPYVVPSFE